MPTVVVTYLVLLSYCLHLRILNPTESHYSKVIAEKTEFYCLKKESLIYISRVKSKGGKGGTCY